MRVVEKEVDRDTEPLIRQLKLAKDNADRLEEELRNAQLRITELAKFEAKYLQIQEQNRKINEDNKAMKEQNKKLREQAKEWQEKHEDLSHEFENIEQKLRKKKEKVRDQKSKISELEELIKKAELDYGLLEQKNKETNLRLQSLEDEHSRCGKGFGGGGSPNDDQVNYLRGEIKKYEKTIEELRGQLNTRPTGESGLVVLENCSKCNGLQDKINSQVNTIEEQLTEITKLKTLISEIHTTVEEQIRQAIAEEKKIYKHKKNELKCKYEVQIKSLEKQLYDYIQAEKGDSGQMIAKITQGKRVVDHFESLQKEICALKNQVHKYHHMLQECEKQLVRFSAEYQHSKYESGQRDIEVEKPIIKFKETITEIKHDITINVTSYLQALDAKIDKLDSVTDEVKMWIKQHLLQTHSEEVQELKQNLLAYQDMIIQLRTEKKAQFAIIDEYKADHERAAANRTRIEEQEKLIVEQRCEIERLKTADIQIAGVPQEVYKKLKKIDKVMEEKMRDEIRKNEEKFKKDA